MCRSTLNQSTCKNEKSISTIDFEWIRFWWNVSGAILWALSNLEKNISLELKSIEKNDIF